MFGAIVTAIIVAQAVIIAFLLTNPKEQGHMEQIERCAKCEDYTPHLVYWNGAKAIHICFICRTKREIQLYEEDLCKKSSGTVRAARR